LFIYKKNEFALIKILRVCFDNWSGISRCCCGWWTLFFDWWI